jgi:valyl-tRNA synthetase
MVQELITAVRGIRAERNVPPGKSLRAAVNAGPASAPAFRSEESTIRRLARLAEIEISTTGPAGRLDAGASAVLSDGSDVLVDLDEVIDKDQECSKLGEEAGRLERLVQNQVAKLENPQFVSRAPEKVVENERRKLADWSVQLTVLGKKLETLGCR